MGKTYGQSEKETLLYQIFDSLHLTLLHYGLWFRETEHQLGLDKAIEADAMVWDKVLSATLKRLATGTKTPVKDGVPEALYHLSTGELAELANEMSKNWVACDGFWFQTIENNYDYEMFTTKRINDSNWVRFSSIEANQIMRRYNIPKNGGLASLKTALSHRQYARICKYSLEETPGSLVLRINKCRVQDTRKKRGLPDYNCKSSGVAEYSYFAEAIDPRVKMKCIACPPDEHPDEWWCAWEFKTK